MKKNVYSVAYFRKVAEIVFGSRLHGEHDDSLNVLNNLKQLSDEQLLKANIYDDLGMDPMDLVQIITYIEAFNKVSILDEAEDALGDGTSLTVEKLLDIAATYQVDDDWYNI